jgi:pimeloyl-ACP methyl ester carboxylesterase
MSGVDDRGFLPVSGGRLYYEVTGEGPPLVLIHAGVANLRQWDPQVPAFAERYRVIRYDTRGWGQSESEHVEFTNRDDLAAVLDHFGAPSARILATSRSGSIALDFTVTHPDRVDALIVVAGGVGGFDANLPAEQRVAAEALEKASEEAWNAKDWVRLADLETRYWVDGPGQPTDRVDPDLRATVHSWILTTYQAEKEEAIPQPLDPPAASRLAEVTMPLMVVIGDLDDTHTNAACRFLAESVPGSRFEIMRGAAHMMNLEQPDRFNRLVLDFLAEADRPT